MEQSLLKKHVEVSNSLDMQEVSPAPRSPTYQPTAWALPSSILTSFQLVFAVLKFAFHHIFTYHHIKPDASQAQA